MVITRTLLSGSLNCCAMLSDMASRYLGSTHWMVLRVDWWYVRPEAEHDVISWLFF